MSLLGRGEHRSSLTPPKHRASLEEGVNYCELRRSFIKQQSLSAALKSLRDALRKIHFLGREGECQLHPSKWTGEMIQLHHSECEPEIFTQSIVIRNDSFTLAGRILKKLLNLVTVCDILEIKGNTSSQQPHSKIKDMKPNSSLV